MSQKRQNPLVQVLEDSLTIFSKKYADVGKVKVSKFTPNPNVKKITISTNPTLSYLPLRPDNVKSMYQLVERITMSDYPGYSISLISDEREVSDLIPAYYIDASTSSSKRFSVALKSNPLTRNLSEPNTVTKGLQNRHIALWQSHGRYYNQSLQKWVWQRPVVFSAVEDMYTQSYVLPYLVPMLENAGANVLLPRERDLQAIEVIVDNDNSSFNSDFNVIDGDKKWEKGFLSGFANPKPTYVDYENPFLLGTHLQATTIKNARFPSEIQWIPFIPKSDSYAVYISYKSLPHSTRDARYVVMHEGGQTEFSVNQTMGSGTWIYLGQFKFKEGKHKNQGVFLSNVSSEEGKLVTADAVKIGGGMGNILRKPADKIVKSYVGRGRKRRLVTSVKTYSNYSLSGYPRYAEGARYWLQWAGAPDSVYCRTQGENDYSDDFQSRGLWVNYLAGGSSVLPKNAGLNIPIDMAFAFHSDAGLRNLDSILGTLAIYTVLNTDKKTSYANGVSRWNVREMADIIQSQIVDDIRATFNPDWVRRGLWNRNYSESRVPEVPTMLLELLSHQNFGDQRYGHDPRFKFAVSRAIYKGMLRYLAVANNFEYVVQPLPVQSFSTHFVSDESVLLKWSDTPDPLEPTAKPNGYIVYTRIENGGFDNGVLVRDNSLTVEIKKNKIYSFKVEAINDGGRSFPSEILSAYRADNDNPVVLIVNGFTRVSGPESFMEGDSVAGFVETFDAGVPYIRNISYTGQQTEFLRSKPYVSDNNVGFGASRTEYEEKIIAGNTFDYPYVHGRAFKDAGYSFVSASKQAVLNGESKLTDYQIVDLILGKERQRKKWLDPTQKEFKTIDVGMQKAITGFVAKGGNILISGSNVISDLVLADDSRTSEKNFVEKILKVKWQTEKTNNISQVTIHSSQVKAFSSRNNLSIYDYPNADSYYIESPDVIEPASKDAFSAGEYEQTQSSAGVVFKDDYGVCVFGFPIETIKKESDRIELIKSVLTFFSGHKIE